VDTIVAGTAGAAQTQTAVLIPPTATSTSTPTVKRTPTLTPTFTPTFVFRLRTATPQRTPTPTLGSSAGELSCTLLSQDPDDGDRIDAGADFDAVWEVRNTGSSAWDENNVDYIYVSGRKMHEAAVYDLPKRVNRGASVKLIVDMTAPNQDGTYKTEWALRRSGDRFCHVDLTIVVR
jgi:hypothetical protein